MLLLLPLLLELKVALGPPSLCQRWRNPQSFQVPYHGPTTAGSWKNQPVHPLELFPQTHHCLVAEVCNHCLSSRWNIGMEFPAEFKGKEIIVYKLHGARDHVCLGLFHIPLAYYNVQHLVIWCLINKHMCITWSMTQQGDDHKHIMVVNVAPMSSDFSLGGCSWAHLPVSFLCS